MGVGVGVGESVGVGIITWGPRVGVPVVAQIDVDLDTHVQQATEARTHDVALEATHGDGICVLAKAPHSSSSRGIATESKSMATPMGV